MSADATDPVKALREWCFETDVELTDWVRCALSRLAADSHSQVRTLAYLKAREILSAAPALLARFEAGEGLLREARDDLFSLGMNCGHPMGGGADGAEARKIHARIDAFLAGKEAPRG